MRVTERILLAICILFSALAGCSANLATPTATNGGLSLSSSGSEATQANDSKPLAVAGAGSGTATNAPSTSAQRQMVIGFKHATVILYGSPSSNDGERVPANSLSVPFKPSAQSDSGARIQIMTVDGPRWIAKSDLTFGPGA
ncbi:hypothetical protein [Hyphomicrobium sp.]|uniref:hypothetical protein n=1 Tax=Hyphomicrobium sp. TaxID=82 RepID=UPI000FC1DCA9|nr:hypothetical protein [Hyphomicrobium sp.]RUP08776.1 MAG: hypothetical protein EKK38_13635 [Hyphomicrobium sp.]